MRRHAIVACAVAAAAIGSLAVTTGIADAAPAAPAIAAASCTSNGSWSTVESADWLRVHTTHSATSPSIGQIPRGARWYYCNGEVISGGIDWQYGYGYNGSTKLTGWVDSGYLAHP
ncbi:MAG TPA: hypothetical protein VJ914_03850 [Pseudonocardiaceae bacterium]|nr:hypothetical protein [Pseudonocardiaceae bacterium]